MRAKKTSTSDLERVIIQVACLDEDGTVMIDSRYNGTGGIKPEIVIPVDQKAVGEIFEKDYDYELEYLLTFLAKLSNVRYRL